MWRWTALVVLVVLNKHISSQPLKDQSTNDRPTRQLVFGDSCSCEDLEKSNTRRDARYNEVLDAGTEDKLFTRTRDYDDCPCRGEDLDSLGASSLLFPTATRSTFNSLRSGEKKEELKPIFNPEVNLASSVLETIRVATDEEYQEALARDAAKSAARAVEDIVFGDASPQESANVYAVVVNPKAANDILSEASHLKQSRCIHPLQRPSGLSSISDRSSSSKVRPWHRKLDDMDTEVGASNINDHIISLDEYKKERTTSGQNELKDLVLAPSSLRQTLKDKMVRPLSRVSKLQSLLRENSKNNNDLSADSSIVHEQTANNVPHFRNNVKMDSIKQKTRPLSLTNLLNLKDVELIPLKDLIRKETERRKFKKSESSLPSTFERGNGESLLENENKDTDDSCITTYLTGINDPMDSLGDPEASSSTINLQVDPKYIQINNDRSSESKTQERNMESVDTEIHKLNEEVQTKIESDDDGKFEAENNCQDAEDIKPTPFEEQNELNLLEFTSTELPLTNENFNIEDVTNESSNIDVANEPCSTEILETLTGVKNEQPIFNNNDCTEDETDDIDSITDSSDTVFNTVEPLKIQPQNEMMNSNLEKNIDGDDKSIIIQNERRLTPLDSLSIDKAISNIKNYILKKQEDLNNLKTGLKNKISNKNSEDVAVNENLTNGEPNEIATLKSDVPNNNLEVETIASSKTPDHDLEAESVTSTPNIFSENSKDTNKGNEISMQDLQKLSDAMLQQEECESKNEDFQEPLNEVKAPSSEESSSDSGDLDMINSPNTLTEVIVQPENPDELQGESNGVSTCETDTSLQTNGNIQASGTAEDRATDETSKRQDLQSKLKATTGLFNKPFRDISDVLKLTPIDPLHTLDNIKDKFTSLFDNHAPDTDKNLSSEIKSQSEGLRSLSPVTATDASTPDFQSRARFFKNSEMSDLDDSPNTPMQTVLERENPNKFQDKQKDINTCSTDVALQRNAHTQASETAGIMNSQPSLNPTIGSVKTSFRDISDALIRTPLNPLQAIDNIQDKFMNWFDKNEKTAENVSPSAIKSIPEDLNSLNLDTVADASTSSFQSRAPFSKLSENNDFNSFELTPASTFIPNNIVKLGLQSDKMKSRDFRTKSAHLRPALEDNYGIDKPLTTSNNINDPLNVRSSLSDLGNRLLDSTVEAANPIYSTLKNSQKTIDSKLKNLKSNNFITLKNPLKKSQSLLDTLSRNQEDLNDKLRSLHLDFTDRVESLRNDMLDKSKLLASEYRGTKPSFKPVNNFNKQELDNNINDKLRALHIIFNDKVESIRNDITDRSKPLTSGLRFNKPNFRSSNNFNKQLKGNLPLKKKLQTSNKEESKMLSTKKQTPTKINATPRILEQKKLRMPTAASVPVPSTVQVPELKTASTKLPPLALRRGFQILPDANGHTNKEISRNIEGEASNIQRGSSLLKNKMNLKKDNKIKVSFSTTPRPEMQSANNFRSFTPGNIGTSKGKLEARRIYEDHNGSPSEQSRISISNNNAPIRNTEKNDEILANPTQILNSKESRKAIKPVLHSWPKATEKAFLSKVKEAVKERLSNVNSVKALKPPNIEVPELNNIRELSDLKPDMARSATENMQVMNVPSLKENVSYKCKMVCMKD